MTEEEKQRIIIELEQENCRFPTVKKEKLCEVCGVKLQSNGCADHPEHLRMQHSALMKIRKKYE